MAVGNAAEKFRAVACGLVTPRVVRLFQPVPHERRLADAECRCKSARVLLCGMSFPALVVTQDRTR
jgi:hypothetical protein